MNDIANLLDANGVFYNIYTDDTVIVSSGENDENATSCNQENLCLIKEWCKMNNIILNRKKDKAYVCGSG